MGVEPRRKSPLVPAVFTFGIIGALWVTLDHYYSKNRERKEENLAQIPYEAPIRQSEQTFDAETSTTLPTKSERLLSYPGITLQNDGRFWVDTRFFPTTSEPIRFWRSLEDKLPKVTDTMVLNEITHNRVEESRVRDANWGADWISPENGSNPSPQIYKGNTPGFYLPPFTED